MKAPGAASPTARDLVERGARLHAAGRVGEAEQHYRNALALDPDNANALHLLGVVAYQSGHFAHAEQLIRDAIERDASPAMFHANHGRALHALTRSDEAIAAFRRALQRRPAAPQVWSDMADALAVNGRTDEARAAYETALGFDPGAIAALFGLARLDEVGGRTAQAERGYRAVLDAVPSHVEALINLGNLCQDSGRIDEALVLFDAVVAADEKFAPAYFNRGDALRALGRLEEAQAAFATACALDPALAEAHAARASVLRALGRHEEALASLDRSLTDARPPRARVARGNLLMAEHRIEEALADFDAALADDPDDAEAHFSKGLALLLAGRFAQGWPEYEYRFRRRRLRWRRDDLLVRPRWRGEPVAGRTVLLHAEQGLGDTLQSLRYVPMVAARGARVVLEVQPELLALAQGVTGADEVIARGEPLPAFDLQCPLMSLAGVFGDIPDRVPYLAAPASAASATRRFRRDRLHVGVVWRGNPSHPNDAERSIAAARMATLAPPAGVVLHGLQKGAAADDMALLRAAFPIEDAVASCRDFAETAAVVSGLDLVIGVDTAVVHLAGALGRPVWTLLAHAPDWRWMLGHADSPWYPTMRLFRQRRPADWDDVLGEVGAALAVFAHAARRD